MATHNVTRAGSKSKSKSKSEPEPESLITSSAALLAARDFSGCRHLIQTIPRSDPNISLQLDQILTIADVLSASLNRISDTNLDWYSILHLRRQDAANRDLVRQQFKTLVRLLDPNKNKFPFAEDALMRVREAWFVISDPARRACFDREISRKIRPCGRDAGPPNGGAVTSSFWTMCPYCWYLHEYEKKYEGCSFRCGNCRRTFHGVAVKPPAPDMVVEGKEQYYCYEVSLPLRYPVGGERRRFGFDDDDDDVRDSCVEGNGKTGFQSNGKKRMRIKTVANRVRMKGFIEANSDSDSDAEDDGAL